MMSESVYIRFASTYRKRSYACLIHDWRWVDSRIVLFQICFPIWQFYTYVTYVVLCTHPTKELCDNYVPQ